jgi:uncharacterized protein (TIGR02452 family)
MNKARAAEVAEWTLAAVARGRYTSPSGATVHVAREVAAAVDATREYPPEHELPPMTDAGRVTSIHVVEASTLEAARALVAEGADVAALNFASAKRPGGGFRSGARAQEESIARVSGLYACLKGRRMYDAHRKLGDFAYTDWVIHSPGVPVLCDDEGTPLERPWRCAFLTSAAPNAREMTRRGRLASEAIRLLEARIERLLCVAARHGHTHLVLGAWGCGVFRNDPGAVAQAFRRVLRGPARGVFEEAVFAILDETRDRRTLRAFERSV